eukprot:TRINITY_DN830_c0_g1_i3.p2 TRINITY_DN830_c0_g1~~TRINITY_DN830_c0_g1_i3.p2  ORF type:complete len:89 (+),score=17.78 TRINITY_DN830_c0_g1_i3:142-408(+)
MVQVRVGEWELKVLLNISRRKRKLKERNTLRDEDPREALLKWNKRAAAEPVFVGNAYSRTQPSTIFDTNEYDDEGNIVYRPKKKRKKD